MKDIKSVENMVDERFELCSLIFRFVGNVGHNDTSTEYQRKVEENFKKFRNHETVEYAKSLNIGYDAVPKFAFNIKKQDSEFVFSGDLHFLMDDERWSEERAKKFLILLNKFYKDAGYGAFYQSHISFFEGETQKFIEETYKKVDFEWLGKHMDISKQQCVHSPSLSRSNYSTSIGDYCYTIVPLRALLVHEYCHAFANPIAHKWYNEKPEFKKMCDDTAALKRIPWYISGLTFAYEYVTRAYDILYHFQHGAEDIDELFANERNHVVKDSFPYIEEIYNMISEYDEQKSSMN